jgi:hypothetical protein
VTTTTFFQSHAVCQIRIAKLAECFATVFIFYDISVGCYPLSRTATVASPYRLRLERVPMPTRREFLAATSAACVLAALPKALLGQQAGGAVFSNASLGAYDQGILSLASFQGLVGSTFMAFLDDTCVAFLQLVSATAVASHARDAGSRIGTVAGARMQAPRPTQNALDTFTLNFTTGTTALPQLTYLLDHGTLGRFAVFLVPGAELAGLQTCTASFNYLPMPGRSPVRDPGGPQPRRAGSGSGAPPGDPSHPGAIAVVSGDGEARDGVRRLLRVDLPD